MLHDVVKVSCMIVLLRYVLHRILKDIKIRIHRTFKERFHEIYHLLYEVLSALSLAPRMAVNEFVKSINHSDQYLPSGFREILYTYFN